MIRLPVAIALILVATGCRADETGIAGLIELMEGTFVTADGDFTYRRIRISAPALGEYIVYLQVNQGEDQNVYRQRILLLREDSQGAAIVESAFSLAEPERFEDASADDDIFKELSFAHLSAALPNGCEQRWRPLGAGWSGVVDPATCRIVSKRTGLPRRIESEARLSQTELQLVERGYDDSGTQQLFGTPPGEWLELQRK